MIAILLSMLFTATGLLALAVIGVGARRFAAVARDLRAELAHCPEWREVRVRFAEVRLRPTATVLRPAFTAGAQRPLRHPALPAAA